MFSDCKPDEKESEFATILLRISHKASGQALMSEKLIYKDSSGQEYSVKNLDYFISNVKMRNKDLNIYYQEVNSYHLVNAFKNPNNTEIILRNVPKKKFGELEFSIGLDSIANSGIDKTGDLDPGTGMYWTWAEGYKFFVITGTYKNSGSTGSYVFHIGGNRHLKTLTFNFSSLLGNNYDIVKDGQIIFEAEISSVFASPNKVDLRVLNDVMTPGAKADTISANYANGFLKLVGAN